MVDNPHRAADGLAATLGGAARSQQHLLVLPQREDRPLSPTAVPPLTPQATRGAGRPLRKREGPQPGRYCVRAKKQRSRRIPVRQRRLAPLAAQVGLGASEPSWRNETADVLRSPA